MNLSGTTHLKLESRPAFRNFPDSANLEDKKGRFESQLPDLSFAFMSDLRNGSKLFLHSHFEDVQRSMTKENVESRGAYFVVSVCISLYRYRYINLVNLFGLSFRNFHHQDLFSLNLDLVYGGITAVLLGRDNHRVSLRQLQISKQDNHGVQRKFAFSRQFVRGVSRDA